MVIELSVNDFDIEKSAQGYTIHIVKIPREKGGRTTNNITFGVQVGSDTGRSGQYLYGCFRSGKYS